MKLRNKETGEYGRLKCIQENEKSWFEVETKIYTYTYDTLAELNKEWEDYEEPKKFWEIDDYGRVQELRKPTDSIINPDLKKRLEVGNYFKTKEEAEKAVEKLKAWKRLKDKGFKFKGYYLGLGGRFSIEFDTGLGCDNKDLDLLFEGEE